MMTWLLSGLVNLLPLKYESGAYSYTQRPTHAQCLEAAKHAAMSVHLGPETSAEHELALCSLTSHCVGAQRSSGDLLPTVSMSATL